jgi:hypothetical protein
LSRHCPDASLFLAKQFNFLVNLSNLHKSTQSERRGIFSVSRIRSNTA